MVAKPLDPLPRVATGVAIGGVSWAAILAGATGAAALSLILLILGTGLGLSSVSPWVSEGVSAQTFGASTIVWVSFTQLAAAGIGGYLAGRLRGRWESTPGDEVYFRDTAHGFLAWALATLVTAALLTHTITAILSGGAQAGAAVAGGVASTAAPAITAAAQKDNGSRETSGYFIDSLFRKDTSSTPGAGGPSPANEERAASTAEVTRIFVNGLSTGTLPRQDAKYVGQIVAQRTGLAQADAEKRVTETFGRMQAKAKEVEGAARAAADKARKASAYGALWLFVSLLIGAFCGSFAATIGGRHRDRF